MSHHLVDAKGLLCPMPVIRTQDKIESLQSGDIVEVHSTDPGTMHDIPAWCRINKHQVLSSEEVGDIVIITIKVT